MKIIVIPARAGSKRIINKNIKHFNGKPIVLFTIDLLLSFNFFDKIFVSTNCMEVKKLLKNYNSRVIIINRPDKFSTDYSTTYDVMKHAINKIGSLNFKYIYCCYPTSVFLQKIYFTKSYLMSKKIKFDYIFSAKKNEFPIEKMFAVKNKKIKIWNQQILNNARSQDMTKSYVDAAQFYLGSKEAWLDKKIIYNSDSLIYKVKDWKIIDIDNRQDWKMAELLMKKNKKNSIKKDLSLIDKVQGIRSKNNTNWMDILRIALKYSPEETKKILKNINEKDQNISKLLKSLSE